MTTEENNYHPIIGRFLERMRTELHVNIADLAHEIHIANTTYGDVKRGSIRN